MSRWQGPDRVRTTPGSSTAKNATDVDRHVCVATSSCTEYGVQMHSIVPGI